MAALSRFIARLGEKGLPFFKLLRKHEGFEWSNEANAAFEDVKRYLTSASILVSLRPEEMLLIYLAATPQDPQYDSHDQWMMYFDGSLTLSGSGAGVVLVSPTGETLKYAIQLNFQTTNNVAEYEGVLYKRSTQGVLMRCIPQNEGLTLLHDIHGCICGNHASYRTLVGKAFRQGFYWPTALYDAKELVKKCVQCQFHNRQIHQPAQALQTIPLSWPFATWGLDILGPFPKAPGGFKFLFVAIDTFTKWIEAELVTGITMKAAKRFMVRCVITRFGVPSQIITDNGETSFFLVFGAEAMLPPELKTRSTRVETFNDSNQEQLRADDINLLEERRNQALIRSAIYQQALRRYYDRMVQPRSLAVGDLVLRLCQSKSNRNKLSPKWEGPYTVVEVTRPGSVRLAMEDGQVLSNSWNIDQLRKFYV
uniref:Putative retrotransposon protein n=1 Tax=Phyllostachys edulis TaxID=38705 RepID=D3IVH7_PHYED|nr:putative retrotransposon protein [Phyllostachys edulis]